MDPNHEHFFPSHNVMMMGFESCNCGAEPPDACKHDWEPLELGDFQSLTFKTSIKKVLRIYCRKCLKKQDL